MTFIVVLVSTDLTFFAKMVKQASNQNDDPAGIRWKNSDLISFTYKMKALRAETPHNVRLNFF